MRLREIINLARGFRFLCVFVAVIQTENRVKGLRRLSGNFILLKASLFNKELPFRARPSQPGLPSVSLAMWGGVGQTDRHVYLESSTINSI